MPRLATLGLIVWLLLSGLPAAGQEPTARELERERIRGDIEGLLAMLHDPDSARANPDLFHDATDALVALGPAAVEYLAVEIDQPSPSTFHIASYALGLLGGPEAVAALKQAFERIQGEPGKFAKARKEWVTYALAIAGEPEAVTLLETFPHQVGGREFMDRTRLLDVVALLTAPESVPLLAGLLEGYLADPEGEEGTIRVVRALGRVGGVEVGPLLLPLLEHPSPAIRATAADGLGRVPRPSPVPALLARLEDEDTEVERAAMRSITKLADASLMPRLREQLEREENTNVRVQIYALLAEFLDDEAAPALASYWGRPDFVDRLGVVDALGTTRDPAAVATLRLALRDTDAGVRVRALTALGRIGSADARELLLAAVDGPWNDAAEAIEQLLRLGDGRVGARVGARLLSRELSGDAAEPRLRAPVTLMGEALVRAEHVGPIDRLLEARAKQSDHDVALRIESVVRRLEAIVTHGDEVAGWQPLLRSDDPAISELAAQRLARIGGKRAAAALDAALDADAAPELGRRILRAVGETPSRAFRPLVERVLGDPRFDDDRHHEERALAGWAARRIGGKRMVAALRSSVERRRGLDIVVVVALALADGKDALELIRSTRVERLADVTWTRGLEVARVDWLTRRIAAGRDLGAVDRRPDELPRAWW